MENAISGPGRRKAGANTRETLLKSGASELEENDIEPLSMRDVALKAGTSPAMIRYFFVDRTGFLSALMDYGFDGLKSDLPNEGGFAQIIPAMIRAVHNRRWLALLLVQTVFAGNTLRSHFETRHAPELRKIYSRALASSPVTQKLPPPGGVIALISLIVFPAIARHSFERVFSEIETEGLAEHIVNTLSVLFEVEGVSE